MLVETAGHGMVLIVRGDLRGSAEQLRLFAILVHDDMLASVVRFKALVGRPGGPESRPDSHRQARSDRRHGQHHSGARRAGAQVSARGHRPGGPSGAAVVLRRRPENSRAHPYRLALYHAVPFLPPSWNEWKTIVRLARRRYPLVVYLRGSAPFLLLARARGSRRRIRDERACRRALPEGYPAVRAGCASAAGDTSPLGGRERSAAELLGSTGVLRIAIHATAAVALKEWPLDRYVALADELRRRYRADIHFLASPAERDRLEAALAGSDVRSTVHTSLSLGKVAALIAACDLFVGNDSGLSQWPPP